MVTIFSKQYAIPIVVEKNAGEAICLAAQDLQRDFRQISGYWDAFPILTEDVVSPALRIKTLPGNGPEEGYTVTVCEDGICVEGYDVLGTVYGIYAVSTKLLGIVPMCRVTDLFPSVRKEMALEHGTITAPERNIKFRGWFLNDEDLLTDYKPRTGPRYIDYPFYENVMNLEVLDMILETALRLEINLMIPSSFVDIANPCEEELVKAVYRRGLYITQHHVEPMGVSYFGADNYMKKYGTAGEKVSFVSNRARMEEIWRFYAKKWAVYSDRVIWQLGLRGKGDESVWKSDSSVPMSPEDRGAIISAAIATEYRIIAEVTGTEHFYSTATLWMEGAQLYGEGHLHLPESTMVIFSDIGFSQMFGDDFYRVPRVPGCKYGIYYHVGFWDEGPHLAEGCDLRKMAFSYREALRMNSLDYVIVNVSNVRPLHLSAWVSSELLKDPQKIDVHETLNSLIAQLYGKELLEEVRPLVEAYYDCIADLGSVELKESCRVSEFFYHNYGPAEYPEYAVTDGVLRTVVLKHTDGRRIIQDPAHMMAVLRNSEKKYMALYEKLEMLEPRLPDEQKQYFRGFLKHQTFYMLHMTRWTLAYTDLLFGMTADPKATMESGIACLDAIIEDRKVLETGHWAGWHNGERKIGMPMMKEKIREIYEKNYG